MTGELEHFEIARVDRRLRDRLAAADRQGGVLVRPVAHPGRDEEVARRHLEGAQHGQASDAIPLKGLDEPAARAALRRLYRSCHHVAADASMSKWVRSR